MDQCSSCGKQVHRSASSRPQIVCRDCRPKNRCGTWAGYQRHRRAGEKPCGPCTEAAREYARQRKQRGYLPSITSEPQICELCEREYMPSLRASYRPPQRWCSQSCAMAWRNGKRAPYVPGLIPDATRQLVKSRARRLRHAETWDGITDEEILGRDGWRCQIPGCKRRSIRQDLKYPHPRSKSIDHIVPLSLGGDDTAVNKRAAHLGCNMARGNKVADEQLALFGSLREPPLVPVIGGTVRSRRPPKVKVPKVKVKPPAPFRGTCTAEDCDSERARNSDRCPQHLHRLVRPPSVGKTCEVCGREFTSTARALAKTCGEECRRIWNARHKRKSECKHEGCHQGANRSGGLCSRHFVPDWKRAAA